MSASQAPPVDSLTPEEVEAALEIARGLVRAGVPMFVAGPDPSRPIGWDIPTLWQTSRPLLDVVNRWRPGWALCAVGGHICDFLDVDPRNGGDVDEAALRSAGMWPVSYGRASTPSGGTHDIIAPLQIGKGDVTDGIDLQGGCSDGTSRGFVFLSPTVRPSKIDGIPRPYRWIIPPDMDLLAEEADTDDSGQALALHALDNRRRNKPEREPGQGTEVPPDPPGLLRAMVAAFEELTNEGSNRTQELDNLALIAGHGVPEFWTAEAARTRLMEAALANGYIAAHGHRAAEIQINSGLTDGAMEPWAAPDPSERAYQREVEHELRRMKVREDAKRLYRAEQAGPLVLPQPVLLTDLLAEPDQPTQYRIDGLLPTGGRVVLAAQYKAGKTTMVGNLLRCLADGDSFLGEHPVNPSPRRTVLIDNEMPRETIKTWLRDQGIKYTDEVAVIPTRGNVSSFNILNPEVLTKWVELIREYEPGVLFLDCLRPVLDALGLDENHDAGIVLGPMNEIAERTGATELIVVHHMGHQNERSRGDSRIRDWPDAEWRLVRKDDDPASQRFFTAYGRDVDVPETAIEYDPKTRRLTLAAGNRVDIAAHSLIPDLVKLLDDQPGMSKTSVEEKLMDVGVSRAVVRATLAEAIDQGLVRAMPGSGTSVLHYSNGSGRSGQSVGSPGRRDQRRPKTEDTLTSRPPKDQTGVPAVPGVGSPGRRRPPDLDGGVGGVKLDGPVGLSPYGGAPNGELNGQVSGLKVDPIGNDLGGVDPRSDLTPSRDLDAWPVIPGGAELNDDHDGHLNCARCGKSAHQLVHGECTSCAWQRGPSK